jgi:hypothetical protein
MTKFLPLTTILCLLGAVPAPPGKFNFVEFKSLANQKLADSLGGDGNDISDVKKGERTLGGVPFSIGNGFLHLGSKVAKDRPDKIEGIKVDKTCVKIHILHATQYGNAAEGETQYVADGTKIAEYKIVYADDSTETIPVVYGEDVRDWWFTPNSKDVKRGKVVWKGDNEMAKGLDSRIRLYLTSWDNPHPDRKVATIDYLRVGDSAAAAFCVAITLEAKEGK